MRAGRAWPSLAAVALCAAVSGALHLTATAQGGQPEAGGALPDGTEYLMRVPPNWNGTLIRDLDYASGAGNPRWKAVLERGYARRGHRPASTQALSIRSDP